MLADVRPVVERILRQLVLAGLPVVMAACGDGRGVLGGGGGSNTGGNGGVVADGGATGGGGGGGGTGGAEACRPFSSQCAVPMTCPPFFVDAGIPFPIPLTTAIFDFDPNDSRWTDLYRACVGADGGVPCSPECTGLCTAVAQANGTFIATPGLNCALTCDQLNKLTVMYVSGVCGRRPGIELIGAQPPCCGHTLGDHLARAAELEAASIPAFRRLTHDLFRYGAPTELLRASRAAMAEEARHWRRTRDLARRRGGHPVRPTIATSPLGSLEAVALDNVVEGCVRETYGAMVAAYQAAESDDPAVSRLMTDIAVDELGHAALSWKIDAWATGQLGPEFSARRRQAALAALRELVITSDIPTNADLRRQAGLPGPTEAKALLAGAWTHVWGPNLALGRPGVG